MVGNPHTFPLRRSTTTFPNTWRLPSGARSILTPGSMYTVSSELLWAKAGVVWKRRPTGPTNRSPNNAPRSKVLTVFRAHEFLLSTTFDGDLSIVLG